MRAGQAKIKGLVLPSAALVLAVFAVYYATLWHGFVYDDSEQILANRWVLSLANIPEAFSTHTFGFKEESYQAISYRPMFFVTYMLVHAVFGFAAWGWHLVNVLIHAANAVLVFFVLRHLLEADRPGQGAALPALASALVFALHPMNAEAVSWLATMSELTFTMLGLAAFLIEARSIDAKDRCALEAAASRAVPALFFLAAVLIKETAVVLPLLVFIYECSRKGVRGLFSPARVKRYVPYAVAALVYAVMRSWALKGEMTPTERLHPFLSPLEFLLNSVELLARYFKALVVPLGEPPLQLMDPVLSATEPRALISIVAVVAVPLAMALLLRRITRLWPLIVAIIVLPILPTLYSPAVSRFPFADRYLYFPSAGLAMLLAVSIAWLFSRRRQWGVWAAVALIALCVPAAFLARQRSAAWESDRTLWGAAYAAQPSNYVALYAIAVERLRDGQAAEALRLFERSLDMNLSSEHPDQSMVLLARKTLPQAAARAGREDRAEAHLKEYLALVPDDAMALYNMGFLMRKRGLCAEASDLFERAAVFSRDTRLDGWIYYNLAECHLAAGMKDEAVASLREGLRRSPGDQVIIDRLASLGASP